MFARIFPKALVLITEGNNDTRFHYNPAWPLNDTVNAIDGDEKWAEEFYENTFDWFFTQQPKNAALPEINEIEKTYLKGGYYSVEIGTNLTVLSINTLCYNSSDEIKNDIDLDLRTDQLAWLKQ